ncbi:MAG: hypothetical protein ABIH56_03770 [Candidatus Margulisiibacteriota bacterium]
MAKYSQKVIALVGAGLAVIALAGCAANSGQAASSSLQAALDAQISLFDVGLSDAESSGGVTVLQTTSESYCWYRHFGPPSEVSYTILNQDNSSALVRVSRAVEGSLYYHLMAGSAKRLKYFSQDYSRFARLTSADGGTTWSLIQLSPGVAKSTKYSPVLGVGSVACDLTISRVVLSSNGVVIADISAEAASGGPWFDLNSLPKVTRGSTMEIKAYVAAPAGGEVLVYVWPSLITTFRIPLYDEVSGGHSNSSNCLMVATTETTGIKRMFVGAFSRETLSDTVSPYNYGAWHLLYQVE